MLRTINSSDNKHIITFFRAKKKEITLIIINTLIDMVTVRLVFIKRCKSYSFRFEI